MTAGIEQLLLSQNQVYCLHPLSMAACSFNLQKLYQKLIPI